MTGVEYRSLRNKLSLTQAQLAEALAIQRNTVVRRENETAPISREAEFALRFLVKRKRPGAASLIDVRQMNPAFLLPNPWMLQAVAADDFIVHDAADHPRAGPWISQ